MLANLIMEDGWELLIQLGKPKHMQKVPVKELKNATFVVLIES